MKVPTEVMPLEHCALLREHLTAYRLLEDHALKVGGMGGETGLPVLESRSWGQGGWPDGGS